jgi:NitT/TauT family transport system substrate-binding protein
MAAKGALSPDGLFPEAGAATAVRALQSIDETLKGVTFDLAGAWTNEFARKANAKYPKG